MAEKERIRVSVYLDDGSVKSVFVASYPEAHEIVKEGLLRGFADHSGRFSVYYPTHRIVKIEVEADIIIPPPPE